VIDFMVGDAFVFGNSWFGTIVEMIESNGMVRM
jgi:hypothetical protein